MGNFYDDGKRRFMFKDVQHIEFYSYGIMVVFSDTKWNFEHDYWENALHIGLDEKSKFIKEWGEWGNSKEKNEKEV